MGVFVRSVSQNWLKVKIRKIKSSAYFLRLIPAVLFLYWLTERGGRKFSSSADKNT